MSQAVIEPNQSSAFGYINSRLWASIGKAAVGEKASAQHVEKKGENGKSNAPGAAEDDLATGGGRKFGWSVHPAVIAWFPVVRSAHAPVVPLLPQTGWPSIAEPASSGHCDQ
jgi:hypothetical protein